MTECFYIRFTRRSGFEKRHCFLKKCDTTSEECQACPYLTVNPPGKEITINGEPGVLFETPEVNRVTWHIEHSETFRPDLQAIRTRLPRHERGRQFTLDASGVITYKHDETEWEPPKDIPGYQRDSDKPWRFVPLWPKCMKRQPESKRSAGCGCIELRMKCECEEAPLIGQFVTCEQCQACERRVEI